MNFCSVKAMEHLQHMKFSMSEASLYQISLLHT